MKDFGKKMFNVALAFAILAVGIKVIYHFFSKMECNEEEHREPYQPEE
jgi:putative Mn2+ efflux pump MntP